MNIKSFNYNGVWVESRVANQIYQAICDRLIHSGEMTFENLCSDIYLHYHHYFLNRDVSMVCYEIIWHILMLMNKEGIIKTQYSYGEGKYVYGLIVHNGEETMSSKLDRLLGVGIEPKYDIYA